MTVSLKPEVIFSIGRFGVTNSLLTVIIIASSLSAFFLLYKPQVNPRSRFQLLLETGVVSLRGLAVSIMGESFAKRYLPAIFTFFTLILFSNWFGLLPIVGSIGYTEPLEGKTGMPILVLPFEHEKKFAVSTTDGIEAPLFRSPSADLNFTIALALISFLIIEYAGLKSLGLVHLAKFFDYRIKLRKGKGILLFPFEFLINFLWKTLELLLEFAKIISFSFRLFGNIFAGEILLLVITSLTYGIFTFPFLGLELFVGFIQALVFVFLTMVFIKVGSEHH